MKARLVLLALAAAVAAVVWAMVSPLIALRSAPSLKEPAGLPSPH